MVGPRVVGVGGLEGGDRNLLPPGRWKFEVVVGKNNEGKKEAWKQIRRKNKGIVKPGGVGTRGLAWGDQGGVGRNSLPLGRP